MLAVVLVLATLPALAQPAGKEPATVRRTWQAQGVSFEHTADGIRAWVGEPTGTPAFSTAALLAAEKKKFDGYAEEMARELLGPEPPSYGMAVMDQWVTIEVLSIVGPLLAYRESGGGYSPGAAHPTRYDVLQVLDLSRKDARPPSLLDYYSEKQLVAALKADPWVRKFASPESEGDLKRATTLEELVAALDEAWARSNAEEGDCAFDVSFDAGELPQQFFFHHLERDKVAVRIVVPPGSEWCNRAAAWQQIGLLLPVPAALREALLSAQIGDAGFLAGARARAGRTSWSESWEVDVKDLAKELAARKK